MEWLSHGVDGRGRSVDVRWDLAQWVSDWWRNWKTKIQYSREKCWMPLLPYFSMSRYLIQTTTFYVNIKNDLFLICFMFIMYKRWYLFMFLGRLKRLFYWLCKITTMVIRIQYQIVWLSAGGVMSKMSPLSISSSLYSLDSECWRKESKTRKTSEFHLLIYWQFNRFMSQAKCYSEQNYSVNPFYVF